MRNKRTIKIFLAWTLLTVFATALIFKSSHYHNIYNQTSHKIGVEHQPCIKQLCYICEFTMQQATEAQAITFVPILTAEFLARYVVSFQVVYRAIETVNTHSPPFLS